MTILDAVNATVGVTSPNEDIPTKAIIDLGLSANTAYLPTDDDAGKTLKKKIDLAAIAVLMALKILARVDEANFGLTFDDAAADKNILFLYGRSGEGTVCPIQTQPVIRNATNLW